MAGRQEGAIGREELQDEVTRHWPDYCGGCGRPTHQAEFDVEITDSGQIEYSCSGCPVNTYVTPEVKADG